MNNFNDTPSFTTTEKNAAGLGGDDYNQDDFTLLTLSPEKQKYESRVALMQIDQNKNLLDEIQKASIDTTKFKQEYTIEQQSIFSP